MKKQTAGRDALGEFAPKFAELNDDVLFGEVWSRVDRLSLKNRSMITISVLMGKGIVDSSMKHHLMAAKDSGISKEEIAELITHAAFYAGWPNAWAVFRLAKEVTRTKSRPKTRRFVRNGRSEHRVCPTFHREILFKTSE